MSELRPLKPAKHIPFTPDQLHQRAVARRDYKREIAHLMLLKKLDVDAVFDNRAPHAYRGTAERKHLPRHDERRKEAYWRAIEREKAIGINPVYRGACERGSAMHKQWVAASKAWDQAHRLPN